MRSRHGSSLKIKFENTSKVIVFTMNHTDDDANDDNGTKNNMSPHGKGEDIIQYGQQFARYHDLSDLGHDLSLPNLGL